MIIFYCYARNEYKSYLKIRKIKRSDIVSEVFNGVRSKINALIAKEAQLEERVVDILENRDDPASKAFMIDIIPFVHEFFKDWPFEKVATVLDVGAKTGAGSGLLAEIHGVSTASYLKMAVTALDLVPWFARYAKIKWPNIDYIVTDVFSFEPEKPFDIVISSHTIEHIVEYKSFIDRLCNICSGYVFIYCPYNEDPLIEEHVVRIDNALIRDLSPLSHYIITNQGWRWHGDCVLMVFRGKSEIIA